MSSVVAKLIEAFVDQGSPGTNQAIDQLRGYLEWCQQTEGASFVPTADDDLLLRSYLLYLRNIGSRREILLATIDSLAQFYGWLTQQEHIETNPFENHLFDRPILSLEQIQNRHEAFTGTPQEREIARLRALNEIASQLNSAVGIQDALQRTLDTLVAVMNLRGGWIFLKTDAGLHQFVNASSPLHDFSLAAFSGLPQGLNYDRQHFLRCDPECYCQFMLRKDRMNSAINVVECSRLQWAAEVRGDNAGLQFHASVPLVIGGIPAGSINVATPDWQFLTAPDLQLLSTAAAQVSLALERARLYEISQKQRERLEHELETARIVQAGLMPSETPKIAGFTIAADWQSAHEVAGDFYDCFPLGSGRWGLVIADVSDKGAGAALYMAMVRSLIRAKAEQAESPAETLMQVNKAILAQSMADMFVTIYYGVFDPSASTMISANAGHNPPLLRRQSGTVESLPNGGLVLGIFSDEVQLHDEKMQLEYGDVLIGYTDGLIDAENHQREPYGMDRLTAAVASAPSEASAMIAHLRDDVLSFTDNAPQVDDITMLVLSCSQRSHFE